MVNTSVFLQAEKTSTSLIKENDEHDLRFWSAYAYRA
jgi:hypothetical protein